MADMITNEKQLIHLLNNLTALDYDAIAAYQASIERLSNATDKAQLALFMDDHRRHTVDLASVVRTMGGEAVTHADFKQVLTKGKVVLGGLMGDKAILEAMKSNEDTANKEYEAALEDRGLPGQVRELLQRNLSDERRHRAWIEQRIGASPSASPSMPQADRPSHPRPM